jgi:hypothetical protein
MKRLTQLLMIFIFLLSTLASAEVKNGFDPLDRNLIFVEGSASQTVAVSGFKIEADFNESKRTFLLASQSSFDIISEIQGVLTSAGLTSVKVSKGWDLVKQNTLSFESKAKKISNKITISVNNYPEGELHQTIAKVLDLTLKASNKITIKNIEVFLSEETEKEVKEKLTLNAISEMTKSAEAIAASLGKKSVEAKRVFYHTNIPNRNYHNESYSGIIKSKVSYNRKFKVNSEIVDQIKLKSSVSGTFQID